MTPPIRCSGPGNLESPIFHLTNLSTSTANLPECIANNGQQSVRVSLSGTPNNDDVHVPLIFTDIGYCLDTVEETLPLTNGMAPLVLIPRWVEGTSLPPTMPEETMEVSSE